MVNEAVKEAVQVALDSEGKLSCAAAFRIARELDVSPGQIGQVADGLEVRLNRCQLGLFGYGPKAEGRHKIVEPADDVEEGLAQAIQDSLRNGELGCDAAWEIAAAMRIPKMKVAAAAETLGIKISRCQLGAF
jgi:hypothetical protein